MKTRITELLGIEYPVVQGAMARIADGGLAGAVSEAGGLGIIACGGARPEWIREQVARARALLRRVHADSEPQREVLEFGELTIDVSGHKVLVSGEEIDLTASEFKLLTTLSRYPGRVYSRMELVEKVLGYDFEGYERTIDSHVKNLRAKIGDNPRNPKWLHTVHGVGYRFEDPTRRAPLREPHQDRPVIARSFRVLAAGAARLWCPPSASKEFHDRDGSKTAHSGNR